LCGLIYMVTRTTACKKYPKTTVVEGYTYVHLKLYQINLNVSNGVVLLTGLTKILLENTAIVIIAFVVAHTSILLLVFQK